MHPTSILVQVLNHLSTSRLMGYCIKNKSSNIMDGYIVRQDGSLTLGYKYLKYPKQFYQ